MTTSILQRIAGGDPDGVRECIDQYGALVWRLARRLSRTTADAEDATQEIFVQLWRQAARFDDSLGSEQTFVAMIARRRLIDRLRKTNAEPAMDSSIELLHCIATYEPCSTSETCIEVRRAMEALAELRSEHRQVIELGILEGLTHAEIAKRLGLPLGSVKSIIRRGLMCVRERMARADTSSVSLTGRREACR
jgi:RNA polymerase sigma-70 factor (ECF subfamily)